MDIFFEEKYTGVLGHLTTRGHNSVHSFLNTSFKRYIDAHDNITVSKATVYTSSDKIIAKSRDLYTLFYETPNECLSSQYSEFFSAVIYNRVYNARNFLSEGTVIRRLRKHHRDMDGISIPDIYMTNIMGKSLLVSVTRFNSRRNHRIRAENLLKTKIVKSMSSIIAAQDILGSDRCIIQVFCKSEKNATILRNAWANINRIPSWIYLHIIICKHDKIYDENGFFG